MTPSRQQLIRFRKPLLHSFIVALALLFLNAVAYASRTPYLENETAAPMVRIGGHVLASLPQATKLGQTKRGLNQQLTITVVLRHDDQAGFEQYLEEVYDPQSDIFRDYLDQAEIADKFGPSHADYDALRSYLKDNGLRVLEGSTNRLTITVRGTRAQIEKAFMVRIDDYQLGSRRFYANNVDPSLPAQLASTVLAIVGLNDLAVPQDVNVSVFLNPAGAQTGFVLAIILLTLFFFPLADLAFIGLSIAGIAELGALRSIQTQEELKGFSPAAPGRGQTVGITSFTNSAVQEDVQDLENLIRTVYQTLLSSSDPSDEARLQSDVSQAPPDLGVAPPDISNLSVVDVDGGATSDAGRSELLVDINEVMNTVTGAKVIVYDAPFNGPGSSFQSLFNQMLSDGKVTIITNSWAYCEDETTAADVQSIDTIFQNAAAAGISVFNATGDTGSTCLDGSPNTVAVPADSPNATAVGGSSFTAGPALTYGSETYWNGAHASPPTGSGGYGVSRFFAAPSYQGSTGMRSVPDVVTNADPSDGMLICEASAGGCPNGALWGGTSRAAPSWAAYAAVLNELNGKPLGFLNPQMYPLGGGTAFHSPASLDSDSSHVGLGSPSLGALALQLSGQSAGAVSASNSDIAVYVAPASVPPSGTGISADGKTQAVVKVELTDANGNDIPGKTVSLSASSTNAEITAIDSVTNPTNGTALFAVTDPVAESVTFTATDTTDGITLTPSSPPTALFVTPIAANAGLTALPSTVNADGVTPTDITITLTDSLNRPVPGKQVQLSQTGGNSVISGPTPPVTDSTGTIKFTAVDSNNETITYSAVDVTDGNLPFPETGTVTFSNAPNPGCSNTQVAANGFVATPYATGFLAQNYFYGGIDFTSCPGATGMAFDASGNLYVSDQVNGNLYKIPAGGGVASSATLVGNVGISLGDLVFDGSGNLYGSRYSTGGGSNTGVVVQINPATAAVIRTVASGLTCSGKLTLDPLSGDLFTDDTCGGTGAPSMDLFRISGLSSTPSTSTYATLPNSGNGNIAFAPGGDIYVYDTGQVAMVTGTNGPTPPTVTAISGVGEGLGGLLAFGPTTSSAAQYLIANFPANTSITPNSPATVNIFDLSGTTPTLSTPILAHGGSNEMITGPDGCVYVAQGVGVWKVTDTTGACNYTQANPPATISINPTTFTAAAAQGRSVGVTATVHNATVPAGTPITFSVSGTNSQQGLVNTDANGNAPFSYTGRMQGVDTVVASATINNATVTSNPAVVTWGTGTDVTFLTLNQSAGTGTVNQPVTLAANLSNISVNPNTPVTGQELSLSLGGTSCSATTDSNGNASCSVTPSSTGMLALQATFAGTGSFNSASASGQALVLAATPLPSATPTPTATPVMPTPTPTLTSTPTPTATETPVGPGTVNSAPVNMSASAGQTVAAGSFTVNNTSPDSETIDSVTVQFSDPRLFSSASLSASGETAVATPAASTTFTFSPALVVSSGSSLSFNLTATLAGQSASRERSVMVAYASTTRPGSGGRNQDPWRGLISLCMFGVGLSVFDNRRRMRRAAMVMLIALAMGAAMSACNGGGSGGGTPSPSSSQEVTQVSGADGAIPYQGLPASLGKITLK